MPDKPCHQDGDSEVKRIDIAEFRELGYLQEANRQFFHPLGLALEVVQEECDACAGKGHHPDRDIPHSPVACRACGGAGFTERLGGVWDYREDPEGIMYAFHDFSFEEAKTHPYAAEARTKAARVEVERERHAKGREAAFGEGITIEPLP